MLTLKDRLPRLMEEVLEVFPGARLEVSSGLVRTGVRRYSVVDGDFGQLLSKRHSCPELAWHAAWQHTRKVRKGVL